MGLQYIGTFNRPLTFNSSFNLVQLDQVCRSADGKNVSLSLDMAYRIPATSESYLYYGP